MLNTSTTVSEILNVVAVWLYKRWFINVSAVRRGKKKKKIERALFADKNYQTFSPCLATGRQHINSIFFININCLGFFCYISESFYCASEKFAQIWLWIVQTQQLNITDFKLWRQLELQVNKFSHLYFWSLWIFMCVITNKTSKFTGCVLLNVRNDRLIFVSFSFALIFASCRKLNACNTCEILCSSCKDKEDRYVPLPLNRWWWLSNLILTLSPVPPSQLSDLPPTMLKMDYAAVPLAQT